MSRVREERQKEAERITEQKRMDLQNEKRSQRKSQIFAQVLAHGKHERTIKENQEHELPLRQKRLKFVNHIQEQRLETTLLTKQGIKNNQLTHSLQKRGFQHVTSEKSSQKDRSIDVLQSQKIMVETHARIDQTENSQQHGRVVRLLGDNSRESGSMDGNQFEESEQQGSAMDSGITASASNNVHFSSTMRGSHTSLPEAFLKEFVSRVLVGLNNEGLNEFHIEFNKNILGGVRLNISAQGVRINAKFTTTDKNVSRLLKACEGQISRALHHKGLSLERLEVEGP